MKVGIFADPQYCSAEIICGTRYPRLSLGKVRQAYEQFSAENVDLTLCMGDMIDRCETHTQALQYLDELLSVIRDSRLPFIHVPGNHDYLDFSAEELEQHGLKTPPYVWEHSGIRFIVLDANYRSDMRRFDQAGVEWTDSNLPPEQVAFLSLALDEAEGPCVILVHESLDDRVEEHHIIKNAEEIRKVIRQSGKVKLVIQGHFHPGADNEIDGIRYLTVSAMCEGHDSRFLILNI